MKQIDMKELAEKIRNNENVHVIDVREDEEVAQGKIPGAKHIKLGEIPERLDEMDKEKHYYMVCRSGGRSGKASEFLESKGYDVTNVDGGMLAWDGEVEK
ncbi:rhodanese-like domain-containing protein [Lentibacillus cibarius]|uniref:Rhodanese-like domain-containing protein n=1 Tax=Lentibacillus cibarius TaxID=2583219 RepID=A0A549YJS2_9BACI|nr:rhodanese-like domain-containing protein [Lentibacillus cibarius]TMN23336.1 rhodanese-like domain-containing protein [Lentibacillus cibarius]TRM12128.1 rhodanese-like domain-containing protein [Lentibacillus cibarius]